MDRKFKVGDKIRISDETDMAYAYNHVYSIVAVSKTGYDLRSMKYNRIYTEDELQYAVINLLSNKNNYETVGEFYDNYYRLATHSEILLYGRKEV